MPDCNAPPSSSATAQTPLDVQDTCDAEARPAPRGFLALLRHPFTLTPDQAETLAGVKFPCC